MATNVPGDPAWTLLPRHHGYNTYVPYPQPFDPYPWGVYPQTWPTITTTTTGKTSAKIRLMSSKDVRDLLNMIHDELLASDDADHLALAELIEETLEG